MRITVIGGSHGSGALAVKAALDRGHEVIAFSRNPQQLQLEHAKLTRLAGDFLDPASVAGAVRARDAVLITAMAGLAVFKTDPTFFSRGTAHVIDAMKANGVKRLVVLSALGVGDSRPLFGFVMQKLLIDFLLKGPYQDHERQERAVRDSGLDWVIARPSRLTDGPARKRYQKKIAIEPVPSSISRADVADFLVDAAETDTWLQHAVSLGG